MPALSSIKFKPRRLTLVPVEPLVDAPAVGILPKVPSEAPNEPPGGFMELVVVDAPAGRKRAATGSVAPRGSIPHAGAASQAEPSLLRRDLKAKPWTATTFCFVKPVSIYGLRSDCTADWMPEVERLGLLFSSLRLPKAPVRIDGHTTIANIQAFIDGHLAILRRHPESGLHAPYHDRLLALEALLLPQVVI